MSKLSKKILMAIILVSLAIGPYYLTGAYTINVSNGSSAAQRSYSINTSGGVSSGGGKNYGTSGVLTNSVNYKGLPRLVGKPNTSSGVGSAGSGSGTGSQGSTGNTSGGVSTNSDSYKGLPGTNNGGKTGNTSGGVSTNDGYKGLPADGGNPNGGNDVSKCDGRHYPTDIDGHWAEIYIRRLYDLCVVEGYNDQQFRPDQRVTRAELVKMSLASKGIKPNPGCYDADCGSPFIDLDMWQGPWIRPAWDLGIIQGYSHDIFKPNQAITRAEAVKVILATYDYSPLPTAKSFFHDVSGWSIGWIEKAHEIGLVQGVGNGNFDPNRPITRAEAAKIIAKIIEYWDTKIK